MLALSSDDSPGRQPTRSTQHSRAFGLPAIFLVSSVDTHDRQMTPAEPSQKNFAPPVQILCHYVIERRGIYRTGLVGREQAIVSGAISRPALDLAPRPSL